jgi:hypothetical protein
MRSLLNKLNPPTMTYDRATGTLRIMLYKWWKPWTWRNGSRKGDTHVVKYESNYTALNDLEMEFHYWDDEKPVDKG